MTREETRDLLAVLQWAYPHAYRGMSKIDADATVALWAELFKDDPAEEVAVAVKALIATREVGYAPTIGEVKERLRRLRNPGGLSEAQAWALVSRACGNGIYGAEREFQKLPPEIQRVVGSPQQLREWAMTDASALQTVVASNFQRAYRATQERERESAMLPAELRQAIGGMTERWMLPEKQV